MTPEEKLADLAAWGPYRAKMYYLMKEAELEAEAEALDKRAISS